MNKFDNLRRHEVVRIFEMHDQGRSNREIGRYLRWFLIAVGDVVKERRRYRRAKRWERLLAEERARFVMEIRQRRRSQGRKKQWLKSPQIREHVERCLCERKMSPEMIATTLGRHCSRTTLTAKAIYNFTRKARLDLRAHLPEKGKVRRQRVMPGFRVYFCHPYQSQERGAVEHANR
jgi:IS30 family transposase